VTTLKIVTVPAPAPVSDLASETHLPKPYDIVQGMERVMGMMEETLQIVKEPSAQHRWRRTARPSAVVCDHPATPTPAR
jgi:hypothetical protein